MFKHKKAIIMLSVLLVICAIIAVSVKYLYVAPVKTQDTIKVSAYFLNPTTNKLEIEEVVIPKAENTVVATELLNVLYQDPKNKNLKKIATQDIKYLDNSRLIDNNILELELPEAYKNLSIQDEIFFRSSLVWTMTGLNFINHVRIYVGEEQIQTDTGNIVGDLSRENVLLDPTITPEKMVQQNVNLYFAKENSLVVENRNIVYNQDNSIEKNIVQQEIQGSTNPKLYNAIPSETKIKAIKTEEGVCYVNLSKEFVSKMNKGNETQAVYSIVNALLRLDEDGIKSIKKVQFLVDSEIVVGFPGVIDLSKQLEKNKDIVLENELINN